MSSLLRLPTLGPDVLHLCPVGQVHHQLLHILCEVDKVKVWPSSREPDRQCSVINRGVLFKANIRRTHFTIARFPGHIDISSDDGNTSGGSLSTSRQPQSLDNTTFTQWPKKKRRSSVQLSQVTQQKQSQLDQATAALTAKLSQTQQGEEDKANGNRATFQSFLGIKI